MILTRNSFTSKFRVSKRLPSPPFRRAGQLLAAVSAGRAGRALWPGPRCGGPGRTKCGSLPAAAVQGRPLAHRHRRRPAASQQEGTPRLLAGIHSPLMSRASLRPDRPFIFRTSVGYTAITMYESV